MGKANQWCRNYAPYLVNHLDENSWSLSLGRLRTTSNQLGINIWSFAFPMCHTKLGLHATVQSTYGIITHGGSIAHHCTWLPSFQTEHTIPAASFSTTLTTYDFSEIFLNPNHIVEELVEQILKIFKRALRGLENPEEALKRPC